MLHSNYERQSRAPISTVARNTTWWDGTNPKRRLLIAALLLVMVSVVSIAVPRLLQSLDDGTTGIWRLLVLFANAFGCVTIVRSMRAAKTLGPRATWDAGRGRR